RGLPLRAPLKIFDSRLAAAGMLFARTAGDAVFRRYHDTVFDRFWRRELDIEDQAALSAILAEAGADPTAFAAWVPDGLAQVEAARLKAEDEGIFGVPTFVLNNEMFWGNEHLPDIRAMLTNTPAA
ncbi:MAG TPA: DsbA family protein, partial [Rhodopila sp.]|nr:DsbA family protein [Rhodopila sp.]